MRLAISRRTVTAGVVVTALVGAGLVYAVGRADADNYRTAVATTGSVEQTVTYDGTIASANRSDLAFATAGTVKSVAVAPGDDVRAGEVVVTLAGRALRTAVIKAKADLADAQAYLEDVEDGQIETVTRASGGASPASASSAARVATTASTATSRTSRSASTTKSASTNSSTGTASVTTAVSKELQAKLDQLAEQQQAVKVARTATTEAIAAAKKALAEQQASCAGDTTSSDDPGAAPDAATGLSPECADALQAVQAAQDVVAQNQDALQAALEALGQTLSDAITQLKDDAADLGDAGDQGSKPQPTPSQSGPSGNPGTGGRPNAGGTPGGGGSSVAGGREATAADLAKAQANVDTAQAALVQAKTDLGAATLTAPHSGTVMALDVAAGDSVAAGDRALVIIGAGETTARLSVPVADLTAIKVGQAAQITPGIGDAVNGEVTAIGLVPESTEGADASTTYEVTVRLDDAIASPEGSSVSVALVTETSDNVVTVPISAVSRNNAKSGTVFVVDDGTATRTRVTLGAMSRTRIAVTEGLKAGQKVVLADLDAAVPTSDPGMTGRSGFSGGRRGLTGGRSGAGFPTGQGFGRG